MLDSVQCIQLILKISESEELRLSIIKQHYLLYIHPIYSQRMSLITPPSHEEVIHDNEESISQVENNSSMSEEESQVKSPVKDEKKGKYNPNLCSNKICQSYRPTKYNLTHENNQQNLCPDCIKQYQKQSFCIYCKQIYFEGTDDGKEWIMCDECQHWVHTECADFYANNNSAIFLCIKCKKIEAPQSGNGMVNRRTIGANRSNPSKVPERRKTQECMLNNFGFYWQLSPAELAQDVEKLKQFLK